MSEPMPLEATDPELANAILQMVNGQHPARGFSIGARHFIVRLRHGSHKVVRAPSWNDPCYCGSGKNYKRCCLP